MDSHKRHESQQNIKKLSVKDEIYYQESKKTDHSKGAEIDLEDAADIESAYEDSFDSDESDEELEIKATQQLPKSEIPLYRFTNSRINMKNQIVVNSRINMKSQIAVTSSDAVSIAPKGTDNSCVSLQEKMDSLDLNEVRRIKSAVMQPPRKNMSFTNNEVMKIERDNEILLRKIMSQQKTKKTKVQVIPQKLSSSAINRKRSQKKIEEDNMMLLQRLQKAKSCALNTNKIRGFRDTHL